MSVAAKHGGAVFKAVSDPTRRAMLDLLRDDERSVNELRLRFRFSQPAISQHLGVLRRAGLVRSRREGRRQLYRLNAIPIASVYQWAAKYRPFFDPQGHAWVLRESGEGH
jgi:DNA-binding transcriptional ArsR family regulator